jgi:predicted Zn-dependent protease
LGELVLGQILTGKDNSNRQQVMAALGIGAQVGVILPFSRSNEAEADEIGLRYMARAGYDPHEAPLLWERFGASEKGGPPAFLSTHPSSKSRQEDLESQLSSVMPAYEKSPRYGIGASL